MKRLLLTGLLILLFFCCYIIPNHILLTALTILVITLNIILSYDEKKNLNLAIYYARTKEPLKKQFINYIFILLFLIIIYFLKDLIPIDIQENGFQIYIAIAVLSYMFRYAYFNFNNAVKSFEEGIELPKHTNNIIAWNTINSITIEDVNFTIEIKKKGTLSFIIDDRDIEDAKKIKNQFEKNTIAK